MSLAPITPLRPRFGGTLTPVREGGAGGHWITLHAADSDEGTVHVFIGGNGRVTKGPSSLVGSAIGHLASHPSVKRAEHHVPGHEPPGARTHPQYAEHQPPEKPAPLPGKPYARLHGAAQTRQEQPKEGPEPLSKEQAHAGLQQAREQAKAAKAAAPEAKAADAAVAHQQAQAELAQYRASKDRAPNPWAPHLSPPVGDAKDKELAEKATRAALAHQAVQAQQQQSAASEQQEGQRAHDKEMVRLKAEVAPKQAIKPLEAPPASGGKPGEITKEHIQAKVMAGEHLTREEKGFVLNGYRMPVGKPKAEEPTEPQKSAQQSQAAAQGKPAASGPGDFQAEARTKRAAAAAEQERAEAAKSPEAEEKPAAIAHDPAHVAAAVRFSGSMSQRERASYLSGLERIAAGHREGDAMPGGGRMSAASASEAARQIRGAGTAPRSQARPGESHEQAGRRLQSEIEGLCEEQRRYAGSSSPDAQDRLASSLRLKQAALDEHKRAGPQPAPQQKTLAPEAPTGPAQHKPATAGDPIQPQRAKPVGQLGLFGEHKPFEQPKPKSEAEQAARGGQKSLFGSSFTNPNERAPSPGVDAERAARGKELERAEREAGSAYIAASTSSRKNPAHLEAARLAHAEALKALQEHQWGSSASTPSRVPKAQAPESEPAADPAALRTAERAASDAHHQASMAHIQAGGTFTSGGHLRGGSRATRDAHRATQEAMHEAGRRASLAEVGAQIAKRQPVSAPQGHDEGHVRQIMQAHEGKDAAGREAYRQQMQRIASNQTYRPTMPDGQPLSAATAAEAARRMLAARAFNPPKTAAAHQGTPPTGGTSVTAPGSKQTLEAGGRLLKGAALDPARHEQKVAAAVAKATAGDPYEGAVRGYARHGADYAQRLAHLEAAGHYQKAADALHAQHADLTNADKGGALGAATRHIEHLTALQQRAGDNPAAHEQLSALLERSQAITGHYSAGAQQLGKKAEAHRRAHEDLKRRGGVRESGSPFAPPVYA